MTFDEPARLTGAQVISREGEKIGKVEQVYQDSSTGRPEWVAVRTGWFGGHVSLVPLAAAEERDGQIAIPYDKEFVKNAPHQDPAGQFAEADEAQLFQYYGVPYAGQTAIAADTAGEDGAAVGGTANDAMTRSEERIRVGTVTEPTGRVRLRKYVVTEQVQQTVPVSHEEVRIEREPVTEANIGAAMQGPDITEAEHEVTLHAERPVVEKYAEPVERVRLTKETIPGEETVSEEIRKERIEAEGPVQEDQGTGRHAHGT
ncbi:MAG: PRC and DUF2382 domain-containing protein [Streptosporangiaceae bacterium]|nr:PRC and DUF2382 domain-containing protein [Streptosporangiaceae bacterium]MBV9856699.1 PRC and DUF2382 domain-containing protein [Streptosporangiaceae bacterium]